MIPTTEKMTATEFKTSLALACVLFLRMFGLFMILPTFSIDAQVLQHATPLLIGLAFGLYGLTQAILQIPLGMLSDQIGRKPVILFGLLLFIIGSVIASVAESIWLVIAGRIIQGCGAVSSALMGLVTDLIPEQQRIKAMALIGISIGMAFAVAFILSPIINSITGFPRIFQVSAAMALLAIIVLYVVVPTPQTDDCPTYMKLSLVTLRQLITTSDLLRLNVGVFILHAVLMSNFVTVPALIQMYGGLPSTKHWQVYLPVLLMSLVLLAVIINTSLHKHHAKHIFRIAIIMLLLSQISYFFWHDSTFKLSVVLLIFFTAFNYLEALLPSSVSIIAPLNSKGSALGIHASYQFIGMFTGGLIGGIMYHYVGMLAVFTVGVVMTLLWLLVTLYIDEHQENNDQIIH